MQTFKIEKDISLFGVQATSFPAGVQQAWQELHNRLSTTKGRNFYGLSHGTKDGGIVYKACVEESFDGEAASLELEKFILPKGDYIGETVHDFMQQIEEIGQIFRTLLSRDDYDKENGKCVEQYISESNVVCMIKKAEGANESPGRKRQ